MSPREQSQEVAAASVAYSDRPWRALAILALLMVSAFLVARAPLPLGGDFAERITGAYEATTLQAWELHGPASTGGLRTLGFDPADPEVGESYPNHPMAPVWLAWLLGRGAEDPIAAGRLAPALVLVLAFAWVLFSGRGAGRGGAPLSPGVRGACTVALAASPAVLAHGELLCAPTSSLAGVVLAGFAWVSWRRDLGEAWPPLAFWLGALWAGFSDWNAYALVPLLWLDALWRGPHRLRAFAGALLPFLFAFGVHLLLAARQLGGFGALSEWFGHLLETRSSGTTGARETAQALLSHARGLFGDPLLVAGALGGLAACVMPRDPLARVVRLLLGSGLLALFVFRFRAFDHPFWVGVSGPGLAVATVHIVRLVVLPRWPRRGLLAGLLLAALVLPAGIHAGQEEWQRPRGREAVLAAFLRHASEAGDLVVVPGYLSFAARHSSGRLVFPLLDDPEARWPQAVALARERQGPAATLRLLVLSEELSPQAEAWLLTRLASESEVAVSRFLGAPAFALDLPVGE